jgi:predicted transcriptional regulator
VGKFFGGNMTNTTLLNQAIDDSGMTKTFIAAKMGCSRMRLYSILKGSEVTVSEMVALSDLLRLNSRQKTDIFLTKKL